MSSKKVESSAIAKNIRELMGRHGVGERKQTGELARILDLGFSAAHRKMNGEVLWTASQIMAVAAHYNERPGVLLDPISLNGSQPSQNQNMARDATLTISGREFACIAQIGDALAKNQPASFVAYVQAGQWRVVEAAETPAELDLYKIEKIEFYVERIRNLSIAVVDDDKDSADTIRDYLNELGFRSTAFYTVSSAATAISKGTFDGYILDWFVGAETSENLLTLIRESDSKDAPVILLTGQMLAGKVPATEVAGLMRRFNVLCQEKPVRMPIITAELFKMFKLK